MAVKNGAYSLDEKRQAVAYFTNNEVPKQIEQLLNKMFKEKPSDIFGYMAEYFGNHSKTPTICKVSASEILGSRGFPSFEVNFHCTVNGLSKHVASIVSPVDSSPPPESPPAKVKTPDLKLKTPDQLRQQKGADATVDSNAGESDGVAKRLDIDEVIQRIDTTIAPLIMGFDSTNQKAADETLQKLEEQEKVKNEEDLDNQIEKGVDTDISEDSQGDKPDETKNPTVAKEERKQSHATQDPSKKTDTKKQGTASNKDTQPQAIPDLKEEHVCRDCAMVAVSMGIAATGATIKGVSVYEHLARVFGKEMGCKLTLPIPMMALLTSGKLAAGKQNLIKEVLVVSQPGTSMSSVVYQFTKIHQQMAETLVQKYGPSGRCVTADGSYSPSLDKPELALDLVQDAVSACGYSLGVDVHLALNCAASEFYDQEKQKYEIMANTFKSVEDVMSLYGELYDRYPGIIAIVDGIRSPDRDGWKKLNQRIGEKCFIVGGDLYRKHASVLKHGVTEKLSSVVALSVDQANTIAGLVQLAESVEDQGGVLMLSDGPCADPTSILVDLAVAFGARFIKLGGPVRAEHIFKYRRLQQIERELGENDRLASQEQHVFPVINVTEGIVEESRES